MSAVASEKKSQSDKLALTERLSDQMETLFLNGDYSDVTFIVESQRLPAHRLVLAVRSEYFRAMLYGGLSETTQSEVELKVPLEAFKILLRYIYTGRMTLSQIEEKDMVDTIRLAGEYGLSEIELATTNYLREVLSVDNVCMILDTARLHHLEALINVCYAFMDYHAHDILRHSSFKELSKESLEELLQRNSLVVSELEIFVGVNEWHKYNVNVDIEPIGSHVRLSLINEDVILDLVRQSGIFDPNRLLDAIRENRTSKHLPYRGVLRPEENIASLKFDAQTVEGGSFLSGEPKMCTNNSDGFCYDSYRQRLTRNTHRDGFCYDMFGRRHPQNSQKDGYACHEIGSSKGIIVQLGEFCIINHIKFLLWDKDTRSYSYYIEVGVDQEKLECVVDYKKYLCRSWQYLYFPSRTIKYIKLVGTSNTAGDDFHAASLEAMYTANVPKLVGDIVAPTHNVATTAMCATVIEEDSDKPDEEKEDGTIMIQLGQPYHIGSIRLLFDEQYYSVYIETSNDKNNWEQITDFHTDTVQSYQHYIFPQRPVSYIRIVGTHIPVGNEFFSNFCVECPSQDQIKI